MRRDSSKEDKQAYQIFAGLGILILIVVVFKLLTSKEKVDRVTNCPEHIVRESVFVLDRTSPIPEQTKEEIRARIIRIINDKVEVGERITFYEVNEKAYNELKPLALSSRGSEFCKPRQEVNALVENQDLTRKKYDAKIKALLSSEVLKSRGSESKSPIAQVIFDVSLSQHMSNQSVSFYLFSDLMENSKDLSIYGCKNKEAAVSAYKTARIGRQLRPSFKNIKHFEIHRVPTHTTSEVVTCRDYFWNWFFGDIQDSQEVTEGRKFGDLYQDLPG